MTEAEMKQRAFEIAHAAFPDVCEEYKNLYMKTLIALQIRYSADPIKKANPGRYHKS